MAREIHSADELLTYLHDDGDLAGIRLQGVDLSGEAGQALRARRGALCDVVILGGVVPADLARSLVDRGALLFPTDPHVPIDAYRSSLYRAEELYAHLDDGYAATPDARSYAWLGDRTIAHDAYATALRALHDDSMRDALHETLDGRRTVGIMGGHAMSRDSTAFAEIAHLARDLADDGAVVLTGGGPGAMEAANLGAADRTGRLDDALARLRTVPGFRPDVAGWARIAFEAKALLGESGADDSDAGVVRSVGIPTWFYGHEPPNVFGDVIAKYFSNALREDDLLSGATDAVIVLEGAAGTVQEIFQRITPLYYATDDDGPLPDLVLVGREQWTARIPVWPAAQALAQGRRLADHLHLVESTDEAHHLVHERLAARGPGQAPARRS